MSLAAAGCGTSRTPARTSPAGPAGGTHAASTPTASPPHTTQQPRAGTWQLLPPAPVETPPNMYVVSVWTGRQMLIHGTVFSGTSRPVTLSYTPATGAWRTLAPGPAPMAVEGWDSAVWTGSEMLVFGPTSAAYNPAANTWRPIARAYGAIAAVRVWTGHQAIFWGGGCCGGVNANGAAYTPASNTWQALPRSPLAARYATGAWTGTEMIIAGGQGPVTVNGVGQQHWYADAAAYNPVTRTWRLLAPMPQARSAATAIWDGTEVLFPGGSLAGTHTAADGMAYNPATGHWRHLPAMEAGRSGFAAVWTGHQVLVWGGYSGSYSTPVIPPHGVAYDPAANRWSALPMSPLHGRTGHTAVWTGHQMIVWGGSISHGQTTTDFKDGAAYRPAA